QQNAGAAEEMSATSEELAAQAEQLQQTISFFRVDDAAQAAAEPVKTVVRTAKPAPAKAAVAHIKTAGIAGKLGFANVAEPAKPAARAGRRPAAATRSGIALDLGGADPRDAEFERS
ncbi:hypothetical protein J8J40_24200, partial [Mycobacterium tuberculosis]|nr:hypothetical protein [Mycobacterium tuberculosis]